VKNHPKWPYFLGQPVCDNFDVNAETPLTLAAVKPRPHSVMMTLVSGGAFLDFRNRRSLTAMHVAADCGNRDAIRVSNN